MGEYGGWAVMTCVRKSMSNLVTASDSRSLASEWSIGVARGARCASQSLRVAAHQCAAPIASRVSDSSSLARRPSYFFRSHTRCDSSGTMRFFIAVSIALTEPGMAKMNVSPAPSRMARPAMALLSIAAAPTSL